MEINERILEVIKRTNCGDYAVYRVENGALVTLIFSQTLPVLSDMSPEEYRELTAEDAAAIVLESDRSAVAAKVEEALSCKDEKASYILTYRILNKKRGSIWIRAKAIRIGESNGAPVLMVSFATISAASGEYAELLDHVETSMYVIDKSTYELLYVNETALRACESSKYHNTKCFSFFNGLETPCPWCSLPAMENGCGHVEENYVPPLDRWYRHDVNDIKWYGHDAAAFFVTNITEQKKQQKQSEERFNNLYKQIAAANPDALAMFRLNITRNTCTDGQSEYETARAQQSSGTVEGYLAACAEIIVDDEIKKDCLKRFTLQNLLKSFQNGITEMSIEYPIRSSAGGTIWVSGVITMMQNSVSGDVEGIAYALNITDQKVKDSILAQISEEKYDHIGLINPAAHSYELWKRDEAYRLDSHNTVDYDVTFNEILDHYICQEDREVFEDHGRLGNIVARLESDGSDTFVYRCLSKTGDYLYKQVKYVWLDSSRDLIIETQTDLTPLYEQQIEQVKKQHEAELAKERALSAESIPAGIGVFDYTDGMIRLNYLNDGFYQMIGAQRDDYRKTVGENIMQAVFDEDRPALVKEVEAAVREQRQFRCRFRLMYGDGSRRWVEVMANHHPLNDRTERFYAAYYDVDELILTQMELQEKGLVFRDILSYSDIIHFTYYPKLHRYEAEALPARFSGLPRTMDDYPDSFIRYIGLDEKDAESYRDMIDAIDKGIPEAECITRMSYGGSWGWYRVHLISVFDEGGNVVKSIGNVFNVDRTVEAEKAISDELIRMESLRGVYLAAASFNVTKDTETTFEAGGGLQRAGEIDAEMLSEARKSEPGIDRQHRETLSTLLSAAKQIPDEKQRENFIRCCSHEGMLRLFRKGKKDVTIEYRRIIGDELVWVSTRIILIADPSTKDVLAFFYTRDISEQKKSEQITHLTLEKSCDFVALLNVARHTLKFRNALGREEVRRDGWNLDAENDYDKILQSVIKKYAPEKNGKKLTDQFSIDVIVSNLAEADEYSIAYDRKSNDGSVRRKQAQYRWLDETKTEVLVVQTDITAAYIQEQERMRQLRNALENAEKANNAKTEFLSRISHDIRTPISAIMNMTAFAREDMNDHKKLLHDLDGIEASNTFLLSLINDVLDISKIDSGKIELHPEPYSYREYIEGIRSMFEPMCKQNGQTLIMECDDPVGGHAVLVDRIRYNQIALNLLSNAVKYTPEGGTITYISHGRKRPDGMVDCSFEVIDTGIGMSREFQKTMFEPFAQEYDNIERKKRVGGTGLGLSIVKRLVDLMGGTIDVESELGKGTRVSVHFILPGAAEEADKAAVYDTASRNAESGKLAGNVLLVEDNELNTEIAVRILKSFGLNVDHAENGKEAVDIFEASREGQYGAILMDIQMPVMDGYDATIAIRALTRPDAKTIPIVAMTADAFEESVSKAKEAGMDDYITKPIEPQKLFAVLKKI